MGKRARPHISKGGLQILHHALELESEFREASDPDAVLVSIDFEHTRYLKTSLSRVGDSQTGLATLDTKDLHSAIPTELISTYNWTTGSSAYTLKSSRNFLFGTSSSIQPQEILKEIKAAAYHSHWT